MVFVAENIDVLVILVALARQEKEVNFLKPSRGNSTQKVYLSASHNKMPTCKHHVLFLHTLRGCDTPSSFYNQLKIK